MNKPARLITGLCLAGCAVFMVAALRTDAPPKGAAGQPAKPSPARRPLAANSASQPLPADAAPLLPPPKIPAAPTAAEPAASMVQGPGLNRPPEESMLISWAA